MMADALGWRPDRYDEEPAHPVLAETPTETGMGTVAAGDVIGLSSVASAWEGGVERLRLEFHAYAGAPNEYDEVIVDGPPPVHERIHGGVHGDIGTVAMVVNTASRAVGAEAGLLTMVELPPPAAVR